MNKFARLVISLVALFCASAVSHAAATFTGNATQKSGNYTESYAQTYTLSGTTSAPTQIKIVSKYSGGSYTSTETFVFAKKGKVTHSYLDPMTGKPSNSLTGTYTIKKTSAKTTVAVILKDSMGSSTYTYTDTFIFTVKALKATFVSKFGSLTNTTTFSGKQK